MPWFDPTEAGIDAQILLLLEAPGRRAALERGSGFVSCDNDDQTAANLWHLLRESGIDRRSELATWNVIPWYLGDGTKIRPTRTADLEEAREATLELLRLLGRVRVVVLLGRAASKAWAALGIKGSAIEASHPSPLNLNTNPHRRDEILSALNKAKASAAKAGDGGELLSMDLPYLLSGYGADADDSTSDRILGDKMDG